MAFSVRLLGDLTDCAMPGQCIEYNGVALYQIVCDRCVWGHVWHSCQMTEGEFLQRPLAHVQPRARTCTYFFLRRPALGPGPGARPLRLCAYADFFFSNSKVSLKFRDCIAPGARRRTSSCSSSFTNSHRLNLCCCTEEKSFLSKNPSSLF